jgi:hypothetical protein
LARRGVSSFALSRVSRERVRDATLPADPRQRDDRDVAHHGREHRDRHVLAADHAHHGGELDLEERDHRGDHDPEPTEHLGQPVREVLQRVDHPFSASRSFTRDPVRSSELL